MIVSHVNWLTHARARVLFFQPRKAAKNVFAASAHAAVRQTGALYAEQGAYHCLGAPRIGKEAPMRKALKLASVLVVL